MNLNAKLDDYQDQIYGKGNQIPALSPQFRVAVVFPNYEFWVYYIFC